MPYKNFTKENIAECFEKLPLILAGPILRRVRADSVTVWVALKRPSNVRLSVMDAETGEESLCSEKIAASKIGERLYLVAITAGSSGPSLSRGKIYQYDLDFDGGQNLKSNGIYSTDESEAKGLCYDPYDLPTFVIPPEEWKDLHILHGSCRKIHGQGLDALSAADRVLERDAFNPKLRPQFLFMTGDQIYADDVSDAVLFMLQDIGEAVLGRKDTLQGLPISTIDAIPGRRAATAIDTLFFTPERAAAKNHLFYFYEFCAMYLMAWSDTLWPNNDTMFPSYTDVFGKLGHRFIDPPDPQWEVRRQKELSYDSETRRVIDFWRELPVARRILANVPCYMILDDHEVTDDWYSSANWCARVLRSSPARNVIRNALSAYAIFQAWGNTPEQFDEACSPGKNLLQELGKGLSSSAEALDSFLNIPHMIQIFDPPIALKPDPKEQTDLTELMKPHLPKGLVLHHPGIKPGSKPDSLIWNYTLNAKNYQIIVLDTRNWRAYPGPMGYFPPELLSDAAWNMHLQDAYPPNGTVPDLTLVVSPAAPLAVPAIEYFQENRERQKLLDNDVEGWTGQARSLQLLLSRLATRNLGFHEKSPRQRKIVILSGDVHYSFAVRLQYWASKPFEAETRETHAIFAFLTASSFKNQEDKPGSYKDTIFLHDHGYEAFGLANKRDWINYFWWENEAKKKTAIGTIDLMYPGSAAHQTAKLRLGSMNPAVICIDRTMQELKGNNVTLSIPSGWRYNVGYLNSSPTQSVSQQPINSPGKDSQAATHKEHRKYSESQGPGMQIVGRNNLGEVWFTVKANDPNKPRVEQWLWWREPQDKEPSPRTRHIISLEFNDPEELPDPNTIVGL